MDAEKALVKYDDIIKRLSYIYKVEGYDAEDLAQEFRMVLLGCVTTFEPAKNVTFNTYLTRSCENRVKRLRRKQEPTVSLNNYAGQTTEFIDLLETQTLNPEDLGMHSEIIGLILDELNNMKYGYVTLYHLLYNISQKEIAKMSGLSYSYINKIHQKNINELRYKLGKIYRK